MKLKAQNQEFEVRFKHDSFTHSTKLRRTSCVIRDDRDVLVGAGFAQCSENDHFEKAIGRKVSFTRALKSANLPKEVRRELWKAYFEAIESPLAENIKL